MAEAPPKVVPISDRSESCYSWSPAQMLEAMLAEIRAGTEAPVGMVLVFTVKNADKSTMVRSWRSSLAWTEEYTYLEVAQRNCLDRKLI